MGGAAGHMDHPFDLGSVNTGSDLLDFFLKAEKFLEKKGAGSVKIDGVNVSFKVVEIEGVHQFAVDRGSMKEIDISGITVGRVDQRFPEGHGMRPAIRTLLMILNKSISDVKKELVELGMWDDPSMFLNTEYVAGTTNVTKYDENFLAIHGLNQFYERTAKSGASKGNTRPGAERPPDVKAPSKEISYNPKVMQNLVKKLNEVATKYGFQVYGSVPTEKANDIDYSETLKRPFTVKISDDREITKSLEEWLSEANNPRYKIIKLKNGKTTHPLHKELYKAILDAKTPIVDLIEDNDAEAAIYGAIFMHATRLLGNDVLNGLTSPMGDVVNHEGVVLRDDKLFGTKPVKITGEFILGGMGSAFQADTSINEEDEDEDPVVDSDFSNEGKTYAIVPGAFKPPHMGHLKMVQQYIQKPNVDEVIVLISSPMRNQRKLEDGTIITPEHSAKAWKLMLDEAGLGSPEVRVVKSKQPSPISATYDFIGNDGPLEKGDSVILGASDKPDDNGVPDWHRWLSVDPTKHVKPGAKLLDIQKNAVKAFDRANGEPFRARDMRKLITMARTSGKAVETLEEFIGEDNVFDLLAIFGMGPQKRVQEMSSMGGGSVQGAPALGGGPFRRKDVEKENEKQKKASKLKKENIDLSIVEEVMELFTEKGIFVK